MIDGLCRVRRRRAAVNVRHQPTFDARVNGVLPVVQIAVNVQRVATTADQHGKLGRQDVAFRSEGDLRRRAAHLQNARQIAVRFYANTTPLAANRRETGLECTRNRIISGNTRRPMLAIRNADIDNDNSHVQRNRTERT